MQPNYPRIDVYKTGQNIRRIMLKKGMTVRDVQEYLGLSAPQSIYHWFDGRSLPTVDNLYALSGLFQMPVDLLLCGNRERYCGSMMHLGAGRLIMYYETFLKVLAGQHFIL